MIGKSNIENILALDGSLTQFNPFLYKNDVTIPNPLLHVVYNTLYYNTF